MIGRGVAWIALAYLAGAIPFGPIVARLRGVDLRAVGSGNIGATNVARALGKPLGILVFLCDAAKGLVPVLLTAGVIRRLVPAAIDPATTAGALLANGGWEALAGGAAFLGHLTSPFVGFRGGKGVATAFGVFAAIAPGPALGALGVFLVTYALTRLSSLGSLLAATAFGPMLLLSGHPPAGHVALAAVLWFLIVVRHRGNLRRLLRREETRV